MEIKELFIYREQLLDESKDSDGYLSDAGFLEYCLPWLNETKYIDSVDVTHIYSVIEGGAVKANGYTINESGERLQLFLVNETSTELDSSEADLLISQKAFYEKQFNRALLFLKKSIKKQFEGTIQDANPAWVLIHQLGSSDFIDQIDVVEIFLLSATATVEIRGAAPTGKSLEFEDESISVTYTKNGERAEKQLIIIKRLIDLNFLYNVQIAQGSRYPLVIDFSSAPFKQPLPCLLAASEESFDSYLCALPGSLLAELYKRYSSRLLEKNVRSFLQLKGVNKGMQDTIRKEPEKFIAYNNGLTITATESTLEVVNGVPVIKSLTDFQIVNGGQTTATLYFSQKLGLDISLIRVMAKINVAKDANDDTLDTLISNISTFSNAQSKVSKVDLRARSPQLVKLKSLSESVVTVSGKKWFFERAKGEYATMLRINSGKKAQIEKAFPKDRRFSKEDLAKYYAAWGDKPFAVKKGGEKIFRLFLEEIAGEGKSKKTTVINRSFYEDLIARIILFRSLEKMYGSGSNSFGQLRSAVVPYSLSVLYSFTSGNKKERPFDLLKIWKAEKVDDDLKSFFERLMKLMNDLIKKYAKSDDLGEYSKKPELWDDILYSKEIETFMNKEDNVKVVHRYTISAEEYKKREKELSANADLDFQPLLDMAEIFDKGASFYRFISNADLDLSSAKMQKLETISASITQSLNLSDSHIQFERELLKKLVVNHPDILLKIDSSSQLNAQTVEYIIKKYNSALAKGEDVISTFNGVMEIAKKKGIRYYSVFGEIGKILEEGNLPNMQQVRQAGEYVKKINEVVSRANP